MGAQRKLVIVDGIRTPFLRMGTGFAETPADELGRMALAALLAKTGLDPARLDEVIVGCVGQPADAANIARVIALRAGVPAPVPAVTVNRNCASGFEAVTTAWDRLQSGRGEVFAVGGVESMSGYPLLYGHRSARSFARLARANSIGRKIAALLSFRPGDLLNPRVALKLGLTDPVSGLNMGGTAELIAREAGITRAQSDSFAAASHRRALSAREFLAGEIAPAYIGPDYAAPVLADNGPRPDSTEDRLARLRPVFDAGRAR
ncbi:MAG: thiolase family protein [Kiritimatiellia bacterium]